MIILLYGPDSYRRLKKTKELVGRYRAKHSGLAFGRFDFSSEDDFWRFEDFFSSQSIFEAAKLVLLENVFGFGNQKALNAIFKKSLNDRETTLLISEDGAPPREFSSLQNLSKPNLVQEFKAFSLSEAASFVRKEAAERELKLAPAAVEFLVGRYGSDSWGMATELEKFSLGADLEEIKETSPAFVPETVFSFINAAAKNFPVRIKLPLLESAFLKREPPAKIFNILAKWRISPALKRELADYDVSVKSGGLEYDEALLKIALR